MYTQMYAHLLTHTLTHIQLRAHTHTHTHTYIHRCTLIHTHSLIPPGLKRPLPPTTARPSSMSDVGSAVITAPKGEEEKKEIHETAPSGAHLSGHEDRYRRPLFVNLYYYAEARSPAILSSVHSSHLLLSPCALLSSSLFFTYRLSCLSLSLLSSSYSRVPFLSHSLPLCYS